MDLKTEIMEFLEANNWLSLEDRENTEGVVDVYMRNYKHKIIDVKILQQAIDKWGDKSQIEMIKEEAIELALAIQKYSRMDIDPIEGMNNIYDELADMKIMLAQAELLFNPDRINRRVEFKIDRLSNRLNKSLSGAEHEVLCKTYDRLLSDKPTKI